MTQKTVTIATINFMDRELAADLRAIDPEIQVVGTAALSGQHWSIRVVELVISGFAVDMVKTLIVPALAKWAKKLFTRQKETEVVKIYGANKDVLLLVERDKTDA